MTEFSADVERILASSKELRNLLLLGQRMAQKFRDGTSYYEGCWGAPGEDEFANAVVSQVRKIAESLGMATEAVDQVVNGIVEALGGEALAVKKPQDAALEDIQQQGGVRR